MKTKEELNEIIQERLDIYESIYLDHCSCEELLEYTCQDEETRKNMVLKYIGNENTQNVKDLVDQEQMIRRESKYQRVPDLLCNVNKSV